MEARPQQAWMTRSNFTTHGWFESESCGLCLGKFLTQRLRADEQKFLVNIAPVLDSIQSRPEDAAHLACDAC